MRILVQSFSATLHISSKIHLENNIPHTSGADMHYPHKDCDGGAIAPATPITVQSTITGSAFWHRSTQRSNNSKLMISSKDTVHCRAQRVIFPAATFCAGLFSSPAAGCRTIRDEKPNSKIEKEKKKIMIALMIAELRIGQKVFTAA